MPARPRFSTGWWISLWVLLAVLTPYGLTLLRAYRIAGDVIFVPYGYLVCGTRDRLETRYEYSHDTVVWQPTRVNDVDESVRLAEAACVGPTGDRRPARYFRAIEWIVPAAAWAGIIMARLWWRGRREARTSRQ